MKTTKKTSKKPADKTAGFSCYIGPSIIGVVQQNKIIPGTVEEAREFYSAAIKKYPAISRLIVDGNELAEARKLIKTPGNLLYITYRKLAGK